MSSRPVKHRFLWAAFGVSALLLGLYGANRWAGGRTSASPESQWEQVNASEDVILGLDPQLKRLAFAVSNLTLPDFQSRQVFEPHVRWNDLEGSAGQDEALDSVSVSTRTWNVSTDSRSAPLSDVRIWSQVFDRVDYLEHAKFSIVRGHFLTAARDQFETEVQFAGLARLTSGDWGSLSASLKLTWTLHPEADTEPWRISDWNLLRFSDVEVAHTLFAEVLDDALPDDADLRRARTSLHEQLVIDSLKADDRPHKDFSREAWERHPGISVVDLDQDGFDDVYVMARWGNNLLFHNNGDGTFREIGAQIGLDIDGHTSSAVFADFDNDGDKDVVLGRTLARSMYLENVGARFVDRSSTLAEDSLPYRVSSVSVADVNQDGLLDVYFSTYAAQTLNRKPDAGAEFLSAQDAAELNVLITAAHVNEFTNLPGPPNVLLRNLGGGAFVRAEKAVGVDVFRNTYQSTWADFDGDGDQDVYLANDFATNNLLRNDGHGRFLDVAEETGTTDIGFGMGASWGDYDNDGVQDLYVSNMYSKAGRRITAQLDFLDPRLGQMARGNSLFHQAAGRFTKVSGLAPPALTVENAGWSWGGQFVDIDNDGFLDIHALSGYYTNPRERGLPDL